MEALGKIIELDDETRKLYSKYDYGYFLKRHLKDQQYDEESLKKLNEAYAEELDHLKSELKINRRQALYHLDGEIRKCHSGGYLPSLFNLDETREFSIMNFAETGENWASFEIWSKVERRKIRMANFWDIMIKVGAFLGFVATALQIVSVLH